MHLTHNVIAGRDCAHRVRRETITDDTSARLKCRLPAGSGITNSSSSTVNFLRVTSAQSRCPLCLSCCHTCCERTCVLKIVSTHVDVCNDVAPYTCVFICFRTFSRRVCATADMVSDISLWEIAAGDLLNRVK